jgi:hypothetical protein
MLQADNNAMTEVALALAMAFFAIFILAAVSMSQPSASALAENLKDKTVHDLKLQFETEGERALAQEEILLIYHKGKFLDVQLQTFSFASQADENTHYVVAVSPDLSMAEMLEIKQQKNLPNLAITLLNKEWQDRLERIK